MPRDDDYRGAGAGGAAAAEGIVSLPLPHVIATVKRFAAQSHEVEGLPEALNPLQLLWASYPPQQADESTEAFKARRIRDIDTAFNEVASHLRRLGVEESLLGAFSSTAEGYLRQNLKDHAGEDDVLLFMRELLHYIALLTPATAEARQKHLQAFPAGLGGDEFRCLEGTRDRLQEALKAMRFATLSPSDRALIAAHQSFVDTERALCSPSIYEGNHPHVAPAIEYLTGSGDGSKHFARPTALQIAAGKAWHIVKNYPSRLSALLERNAAEVLASIAKMMETHPANTKYTDVVTFVEIYGLTGDDIVNFDEYSFPSWKTPQELQALFPRITVEAPYALPAPESLFDPAAPGQVADLVLSDVPANRALGLTVLTLMGHQSQLGNSPIQFLRSIYEMGLRRGEAPEAAFEVGRAVLLSLGGGQVETLMGNITHYTAEGPHDMRSYVASLTGTGTPAVTLATLIGGNAPAAVISTHMATASQDERIACVMHLSGGGEDLERLAHHPDRFAILNSLLHHPEYTPDAALVTNLGKHLTYLGAKNRDLDLVHYVRRGFLPSRP